MSRVQVPRKGWAVIADRSYEKGELVELCPTLSLTRKESKLADRTVLNRHFFLYMGRMLAPLGNAMLYNHSFEPNIEWFYDPKKKIMTFYAIKKISRGQELTHDYGLEMEDYFYLKRAEVEAAFKKKGKPI